MTTEIINLTKYQKRLSRLEPIKFVGKVIQATGLTIESIGPPASIGEICYIYPPRAQNNGKHRTKNLNLSNNARQAALLESLRANNSKTPNPHASKTSHPVAAEVIGFKDNRTLLMPIGHLQEIQTGCSVVATGSPLKVNVGNHLLGRIIGGVGQPLDESDPLLSIPRHQAPPPNELTPSATGATSSHLSDVDEPEYRPIYNSPTHPFDRSSISQPIGTGIKAIDGLLTIGKGQRIGIFSGSGVGKSTLLGQIAKHCEADVNVIALVGERGREVVDFVNKILREDGMKKSVVVAATSATPPLHRVKAPFVATTIAEYFRDQGLDVMLMMDSVTRFAYAQRQIGLAVGEPPTTKGYTPSVFNMLPEFLERAGMYPKGSITGLYTILVEGDDENEPISDAVRSILDGHIILSRQLATQGHYPAIDILSSISRTMTDVVSTEHREAAQKLKAIYATYKKAEDLINIGAYVKGSNPKIDAAVSMIDSINDFLIQNNGGRIPYQEIISKLREIVHV